MRYHTPTSFADAATIAAGTTGTLRFLAGGTDVLVQMRAGMVQPDDLIDLKHIPGVDQVTQTPEGRSSARETVCRVAAGAVATITGPKGSRDIPVEQVPAGPGRTNLAKGEVISAITLPPRGKNGGDAYLRFIPRTEMDIAVVGCAVSLRLQGDKIVEARVALGAVAPTVILSEAAAKAIIGTTLGEAALAALAKAAEAAAKPISDKRGTKEFRIEVAGVLARRAAQIAYDRAKGLQA